MNILINVISLEDNFENKFDLIRDFIKNMFHFGFLKLSSKKSILEEVDNLRKEISLNPILIIQSKFQSIFKTLFKCKSNFKIQLTLLIYGISI